MGPGLSQGVCDNAPMLTLIPTRHAVQRAKDRTGWGRHALERMLDRIFYLGLCPDDCCPRLRDYLTSVGFSESAPFVRLYGDHVFIFGRSSQPDELSLITILHVPLDLRSLAHRSRTRALSGAN